MQRARVIMVGHEHIPDISKTIDVHKNERLDIYSGATNPQELGAQYVYTYNWLEVSLGGHPNAHKLIVTILPRIWVPARTQFAADTHRLGGPESVTIELACPQLQPKQGSNLAAKAATALNTGQSRGLKVSEGSTSVGEEMLQTDDGLSKLRFLFWRYLDWQQRLKVLVQVDVLPATAGHPIPQTMEKMAIEMAKQKGRLADLWDAMAPYLPEGKRTPNPFKSSTE